MQSAETSTDRRRPLHRMLLTYLDESYDRRHYWIAALLCPDRQAIPLAVALDAVVARAAESWPGLGPDAELHGYALFQSKHEWSAMHGMPRARIGVYDAALSAIVDHGARILIRGLQVGGDAGPAARRSVHAHVLVRLLGDVNDHARDRDELVLVIADEVDGARDHRRMLNAMQRQTLGISEARGLDRLVDTLHFAPSSASRLLQAVDLIVYLQRRLAADNDKDPRALRANQRLWDRIGPIVTSIGRE